MASRVAALRLPIATRSGRHVTLLGLILAVSLYINVTKVTLGSRYYILILDAAVLGLALKTVVCGAMRDRALTKVEVLAGLFILMGLVQLFNPNVPSLVAGLEGFRRLVYQMLALFIGVGIVRNRGDVILVGKLVVVASVPILLYGVKQFYHLSELDYAIIESNTAALDTWLLFGKVRAFGTFNGPFHLGLFSGIAFWIAVALYLETGWKGYVPVAAVAVLACLASLTRSSVVALFLSFPLVLFYVFRRRWVRVAWLTVLSGILASAFVFAMRSRYEEIDLFYDTILNFQRFAQDNRLNSRYEGYERGVAVAGSNPLGLGMGSSADAMEHYFQPENKVHITSHNLLLRVVLETGWLGLALFLGILSRIFIAARTLEKCGDSVLAVMLLGPLAIVLITGIGGSTIGAYPVNLLFWSLCGLLVGYSTLVKGRVRGA